MAELMLFRKDADGRDVELSGSTVAMEVELQRRVEAGLEQMLGIRFLASEYPTGPWHRGRIDTLGLDENGSPVVIEFKMGADSGVMSQAVSYLSWLESAQHEFEALVRQMLGAKAAESIDWRRPRMVCIAAGFSHHDRVAVQRLPERIDLVRYRVYPARPQRFPARPWSYAGRLTQGLPRHRVALALGHPNPSPVQERGRPSGRYCCSW
ncbi:hypothetical protein ACFVS7_07955 [Streptomyces rubiginosohelvolus]|uniref:hypothetical protein n=1 Tax=Streptomyces rubiginosohelvolus TaxID=67362 RepID=UPI0036D7D8A7